MSALQARLSQLRAAVRPLSDVPDGNGASSAEFADLLPAQLRAAAVLVPIVVRADSLSLLLTRRTEVLRQHAGQVSFPGGSVDRDDGNALNAALRETWEETGIAPDFVQPIGYLDRLDTVSAFSITPVVALIRDGFSVRPEPGEVAEVFEVPLDYVLAPGRLQAVPIEWAGQLRHVHEFHYEGRRVWGATAAILLNLIQRLEQLR